MLARKKQGDAARQFRRAEVNEGRHIAHQVCPVEDHRAVGDDLGRCRWPLEGVLRCGTTKKQFVTVQLQPSIENWLTRDEAFVQRRSSERRTYLRSPRCRHAAREEACGEGT